LQVNEAALESDGVGAMTFSSAQNFFFTGGTWDMSWIDWIWLDIAPDPRQIKRRREK